MKDEEKNIRNLIKYEVFHESVHQFAMDQISNYSINSWGCPRWGFPVRVRLKPIDQTLLELLSGRKRVNRLS